MIERKKIMMITLGTFIMLIGLFTIYKNEKPKPHKKNNQVTTVKKEEKWDVPSGSATLIKIYSSINNDIVTSKEESTDIYEGNSDYKYLTSYRCYLSDCKSFGFNNEKDYIIIRDDGYLIYDYKNNLAKKLNLPNADYNSVEFLTYEEKDYGLAISNIHEKYAFYDLEKQKFTTEFKYTNIFTNEKACLSKGAFIAVSLNADVPKYHVVNYNSDKIIRTSDTYIGSVGNGNNVYYYDNYEELNGYDAMFYNDKFSLFLGDKRYLLFGVSKTGNLVVTDDNINFNIYNKKGVLIKKSKPYKEIFIILNDYVIVKDNDNYLKIIDYDGNVVAKFDYLSDDKTLDLDLSGLKKVDGKKIIYLVVTNTFENKDIIYYYTLDDKSSGEFKND